MIELKIGSLEFKSREELAMSMIGQVTTKGWPTAGMQKLLDQLAMRVPASTPGCRRLDRS